MRRFSALAVLLTLAFAPVILFCQDSSKTSSPVAGANIEQVKAQMQQRGIAPEDWGGETITVPVLSLIHI